MRKEHLFAVILILSLYLCGCHLETRGIAPARTIRPSSPVGEEGPPGSWSADAFPGYACPADNITLQWNVGDPMCPAGTGPECQTLTITDNLGLLTPPYTSRDLTRTHINGSISALSGWSEANPVFTFSVVHDDPTDPGWTDANSEVVIVQNPPVEPVARNFKVFSAACDGALIGGYHNIELICRVGSSLMQQRDLGHVSESHQYAICPMTLRQNVRTPWL